MKYLLDNEGYVVVVFVNGNVANKQNKKSKKDALKNESSNKDKNYELLNEDESESKDKKPNEPELKNL